MDVDVVVAGGGPVGLMLAAELRLAGVSVTVLERLTEPNRTIKAGSVNGRSTQLLVRRGLADRLRAAEADQNAEVAAFARQRNGSAPGQRLGARFAGHFAGLFLRPSPTLDLPPSTIIPQQAVEQLLGEWVAELGVPVLRGHALVGFDQDEAGVSVRAATADGELTIRAGYLVGCDGGRSPVRKLAGIGFPGTDPITTGYQAIVALDHPERLDPGWNFTDHGLYVHGPVPGRILLVRFDGPPADRAAELTTAELQDNLRWISGAEVTITEVKAATRYTDNTRQASSYRAGRVLLAGDAAHVHPPFGGQGLNLGLQDAANLGWKLAAAVHGWAPEGLLDTYTAERHPVAAAVLANTRAQVAIMRRDPQSRAMRDQFAQLLSIPEVTDGLVNLMQGLDIRYDLGPETHPLVGRHVPDLPGLADLLRTPRPVLVDLADSAALRAAVAGWTDRVDVRTLTAPTELTGLLVRPDGYLAWAAEDGHTDLDALRRTLRHWFGPARVPAAQPIG
jgi:2-polyprenyl-6-methoxyphenol hydroxylase-like FAD-dependent oxidoreductase